MKSFVHIKSTIPANISVNGENFSHGQIDIMTEKDFYIAFFPDTTERYLPCATTFYGNINPTSITKIPYNNNHYEIIFNPAVVPSNHNETIILNKKYNNINFTISNSHKSFISITGINFCHNSTTSLLKSVEFKSNEGYVVICGKIDNEKNYVLIFNSKKNQIILEDVVNKLEISKTQIKALKDENLISGYGKVYEFNLSTKKLIKYGVYLNPTASLNSPELITLVFLESISHEDYKSAKTYLENQNITTEHLKNYFGKINKIFFNGYSNEINFTILSDTYRNFTFSVVNNKISDIEENPLYLV